MVILQHNIRGIDTDGVITAHIPLIIIDDLSPKIIAEANERQIDNTVSHNSAGIGVAVPVVTGVCIKIIRQYLLLIKDGNHIVHRAYNNTQAVAGNVSIEHGVGHINRSTYSNGHIFY